jgi:pimeloyl-ACP methyl ester carboxylesterase
VPAREEGPLESSATSSEVILGCVLRFVGFLLLFLFIAVAARRLLERPASIPPRQPGERDTVVDGVRWRSREVGGSLEPPIVFVHGFLSSSATWKRVLAPIGADHPAIAVDLPGLGNSDRPWPYDYSAGGAAAALLKFLDARDIRRAVLVGNSLGGAVCLIVAAARPDRVAALVLVDSAFPGVTIPLGFRSLRTPLLGDVQMEFLVRPVIAYTLRHRLYARSERVTEETISDWWHPIPVPGTRRAVLAFVRTSEKGYENLLAKIETPTLVVWGKEDHLLPASDGFRLASEIRGAQLVVLPDAGHLPQEETPAAFARTVAGFLRGAVASDASATTAR